MLEPVNNFSDLIDRTYQSDNQTSVFVRHGNQWQPFHPRGVGPDSLLGRHPHHPRSEVFDPNFPTKSKEDKAIRNKTY